MFDEARVELVRDDFLSCVKLGVDGESGGRQGLWVQVLGQDLSLGGWVRLGDDVGVCVRVDASHIERGVEESSDWTSWARRSVYNGGLGSTS